MKKIIVLLTSLLLFISTFLNVNIVVAEDEQLDEPTIAELKKIYENDQERKNTILKDVDSNDEDLQVAEKALEDSKAKQTTISSTYLPILENRNNELAKLQAKEADVKKLDESINTTELDEAKAKLEELKKAEETAANNAINEGPSNIDSLKKAYDDAVAYKNDCEKYLKQSQDDYNNAEDWLKDFLYKDAVDMWKANLEKANADVESTKKAYEDAQGKDNIVSDNALSAIEIWKKASEDLQAQQTKVDELEASLKTNNKELTKVKEELYAMQYDFYVNVEDPFIKAKIEYDDINKEVSEAEILVDSLTKQASALEELLKEATEELRISKQAYETAINKAKEDNNGKNVIKEGIIEHKIETNNDKVKELNPSTIIYEDTIGTLPDNIKQAKQEGKEIITSLKFDEPEHLEEKVAIEEEFKEKGFTNTIYTMDISLLVQVKDSDESSKISNTNEPLSITLTIPSEYIASDNVSRTYKIIRTHDSGNGIETTIIDGTFDSSNNTFTFETDRFSTYALVYVDEVKDKNDSSNNVSIVKTCEEALGRNYTWSTSSNTCVYKVTNTNTK